MLQNVSSDWLSQVSIWSVKPSNKHRFENPWLELPKPEKEKSTVELQRAGWQIVKLLPDFSKITQLIEPYAPTIGSDLVPESMFDAFSAGKMVDRPIILEVSDNEGYG